MREYIAGYIIERMRISTVIKVILMLHFIPVISGLSQDPLRILPLGNSITHDDYEGDTRHNMYKIAYRYKLYQLLNQSGYEFQYTGSLYAGWYYFGNFEDSRNAGWGGIQSEDLADIIETGTHKVLGPITPGPYLNYFPSDIILLHIGTNDVAAGYSTASHINRLLDAVDDYETSSGNPVLVLLARIISREDYPCGTHPGTTAFNNNLVSMANTRISAGDKLIIVDMECGAGINYYTDMIDWLHPNQTGYDKMGQKWFDVIDEINTSPVAGNIPNQTRQEGFSFASITLDNYIYDAEDADQYITWTTSPENPENFNVTIDANRIATITPKDSNWNGTETITFIGTDRGKIIPALKKSASDSVQFTVTPVNDPPEIISQKEALSIPEDTSFEILIIHLNIEDVDNDTSELTLTVKPGNNYTFSGNIITPAVDFNGTLNVNVIVSDFEYDSEVFSLVIEVTPNNDKPIIVTQSSIEIQEDGSAELLLSHLNVTDPDNVYPDEHTLIVMDGPDYTHDVNIVTPNKDFNGNLTVFIKVRDLEYDSDTFDLIINVLPVNDAPKFISTPDTNAKEGSDYEYMFTAEDAEDEVLTFTAVKIPAWLNVLFYDLNGLLEGKPGFQDEGKDTVILRVTDSQFEFAEQIFVINVENSTALTDNKANLTGLVYPNPANNYIKIRLNENFVTGTFQLFNILGKEIITEHIYSGIENTISLNRQNILPGIYLYRIKNNNGNIKEGKILILK
jgi:lysophospholipase L1-like esterase